MSRTIKFRVYNTKTKEWLHDTEHAVHLFGETIICGEILRNPKDDSPVLVSEIKYLVPMQFTGLKDKNGKEIYEGDIVINGNKKFPLEVIWIPNHLRFMLRGYAWTQKDGVSHQRKIFTSPSRAGNIEVIGNIYENPKLLK